jgi:hypothetical protein
MLANSKRREKPRPRGPVPLLEFGVAVGFPADSRRILGTPKGKMTRFKDRAFIQSAARDCA